MQPRILGCHEGILVRNRRDRIAAERHAQRQIACLHHLYQCAGKSGGIARLAVAHLGRACARGARRGVIIGDAMGADGERARIEEVGAEVTRFDDRDGDAERCQFTRQRPRLRFAAVASPAYFERWPKPEHPRDLAGLPCVRYRFDSGAEYHWEFERGAIELALAVEGPFVTNAQDLMVQAALDGLGVAYVFEGMVDEAIREKRLVRVLEDWCPYWPGLYLYYPSRRQLPGALRAFVDFVKAG
jgi:hypothetical protein